MTYRRTKWNRIRPVLLMPLLPLFFLGAGLYGFVLRPLGRGVREAWQEMKYNYRVERGDLRENLRLLWEGYVWAFTGRDLTTRRLDEQARKRARTFYENKLGMRAKQ